MNSATDGRFVKLTIEERFWPKVDKNGPVPQHVSGLGKCWLWTGGSNHFGYGRIHSSSSPSVMAHRVSWELRNGPVPSGTKLLHRCDNPRCVNPSHLFLGSLSQNMADKVSKDRQAKGEDVGSSKLSSVDVLAVITLRNCGRSPESLALQFGVYPSTIRRILSGKTWKHLTSASR